MNEAGQFGSTAGEGRRNRRYTTKRRSKMNKNARRNIFARAKLDTPCRSKSGRSKVTPKERNAGEVVFNLTAKGWTFRPP